MKDDPQSKRQPIAADKPLSDYVHDDEITSDDLISDELSPNLSSPPLPAWAIQEALRRRNELLQFPTLALTHDDIWKRIENLLINREIWGCIDSHLAPTLVACACAD